MPEALPIMLRPWRRTLARYKRRLEFYWVSRRARITLCAGMPRSGSTWLFNAARLLLHNSRREQLGLASGWIDDWSSIPKLRDMLIKIHVFDEFVVGHADRALYSYRDIRDALASSKRMFGTEPSIALAREWLDGDELWRSRAAFVMRYETMLADPSAVIKQLAETLGVACADPDDVERRLNLMKQEHRGGTDRPYDLTTLYHEGHITDGRHGSWSEYLDPQLIGQIEREFRGWLESNAYPITLGR